jgi:hypothetical protein
MKYKVTARYTIFCNIEVDADSTSDAFEKAFASDLKDYTHSSPEDFEMKDAELLEANFTEEQQAFMKAYHSNVGSAPSDVVKAFILSESHDEFCREYGNEYYSGLADAIGVWDDALAYVRRSK